MDVHVCCKSTCILIHMDPPLSMRWIPTSLEHTSMGFPGPPVASLTIGNAEQRSAVYSSSVSTNRLDTAQMAIIKYTLTSTSDALEPTAPVNTGKEAF